MPDTRFTFPFVCAVLRSLRAKCLVSLAVTGLAGAAYGAEGQRDGCAELPPDQQALCRMATSCRALVDEARREECLQLVANLKRTFEEAAAKAVEGASGTTAEEHDEPSASQLPATIAATPSADEGPSADEVSGVSDEREQSPRIPSVSTRASLPDNAPPTANVPPPDDAPPTAQVVETTVERKVLDIPDHFFGAVTAYRRLVRDRQLIAIDNRLLFEGDVAAESNVEPGDRVEIRRTSRFFGESYILVGPSKRSINARRILCERVDLSQKSRQRCAMVGAE